MSDPFNGEVLVPNELLKPKNEKIIIKIEEIGFMKINEIEYPLQVKFIGETDRLSMIHGKIYNARDCGKGWLALVDETGEEHAYPPKCFEIVPEVERIKAMIQMVMKSM